MRGHHTLRNRVDILFEAVGENGGEIQQDALQRSTSRRSGFAAESIADSTADGDGGEMESKEDGGDESSDMGKEFGEAGDEATSYHWDYKRFGEAADGARRGATQAADGPPEAAPPEAEEEETVIVLEGVEIRARHSAPIATSEGQHPRRRLSG